MWLSFIQTEVAEPGSFLPDRPADRSGENSIPISKQRLEEIAAIPDDEIDFSDIPELGPEFFENARLVLPPRSASKKTVTLRLDSDVLDWFKKGGKGHLTRMNAVLRAYMLSHHAD